MSAIFLSASVPVPGRGQYYQDANPFLIHFAVREFASAVLGRKLLVWGGHPAITPMIWAVCEDLGVDYADSVLLYQSRFFEDQFPEENDRFANVRYIDAVPGDREASLLKLREAMFSSEAIDAAVFIGGMEGILAEHALLERLQPDATVIAITGPGGAASELAKNPRVQAHTDLDFVRIFHEALGIEVNSPRNSDLGSSSPSP